MSAGMSWTKCSPEKIRKSNDPGNASLAGVIFIYQTISSANISLISCVITLLSVTFQHFPGCFLFASPLKHPDINASQRNTLIR